MRQTSDAHYRLMPLPRGGGIIIKTMTVWEDPRGPICHDFALSTGLAPPRLERILHGLMSIGQFIVHIVPLYCRITKSFVTIPRNWTNGKGEEGKRFRRQTVKVEVRTGAVVKNYGIYSVGGAKSKNSIFRILPVPFDCPAHSQQETVLPQTNGTDGKPRL